jgi:hypothetical protein
MQLRRTTFAVLRRLALQDFNTAPRSLQKRSAPAARLLNYRATAALRYPAPPPPAQESPHYQVTFTCKPCRKRSSHDVSKQGYHFGSVLITCPRCKNRHIISDHLNASEPITFNSHIKLTGASPDLHRRVYDNRGFNAREGAVGEKRNAE